MYATYNTSKTLLHNQKWETKHLHSSVILSMKLLIKRKPERHYSQVWDNIVVIKENLCMSWLSTVLRSPPSSPSGRVTLGETNKGRDASPFPTRRELTRATPRRCGSPVRTPLRLRGAQTQIQGKLRSFATGPFTWSLSHMPGLCHLLLFLVICVNLLLKKT